MTNYPSNLRNECYTPNSVISAIRKATNDVIDLDPFSCPMANEVVKATYIYTEQDNALVQSWLLTTTCSEYGDYRPVFYINPPYSRDLIVKCVNKLLGYRYTAEMYVLVNSETSSKWYQALLLHCNAVVFPSKRISFYNPYTLFTSSNPKSQSLFYFGNNTRPVIDSLSSLGRSMVADYV